MESSHENTPNLAAPTGPNFRERIGESGLGYIQRQILDVLRCCDPWCYSVRDLAIYVFYPRWIDHNGSERKSTWRACKTLVERGLIFERGPEPYYAASPFEGEWISDEEIMAKYFNEEFDETAARHRKVINQAYAKLKVLGFA